VGRQRQTMLRSDVSFSPSVTSGSRMPMASCVDSASIGFAGYSTPSGSSTGASAARRGASRSTPGVFFALGERIELLDHVRRGVGGRCGRGRAEARREGGGDLRLALVLPGELVLRDDRLREAVLRVAA